MRDSAPYRDAGRFERGEGIFYQALVANIREESGFGLSSTLAPDLATDVAKDFGPQFRNALAGNGGSANS